MGHGLAHSWKPGSRRRFPGPIMAQRPSDTGMPKRRRIITDGTQQTTLTIPQARKKIRIIHADRLRVAQQIKALGRTWSQDKVDLEKQRNVLGGQIRSIFQSLQRAGVTEADITKLKQALNSSK